ncbi:hypothetical protein [Abyssalbus ytuae]|uniref:Fibronectin type-III domain-containing protein n=1 Tax=Abyssalbus ytuae TaxID=2926907 RepID=A0A9E6ZQT7_9FLAO|nr:hypothetical protein [Abyssalbus ytuae]UOB18800.1 hypothetical protein MQE35_05775 [Abyssalbus ytuae]
MKTTLIKLYIKHIYIFSMAFMLFGCGGSDGGDQPDPVTPPSSATLEFPFNNEVCVEGTSVNVLQSKITFTWESSANTTGYDLVIKNLNTDQNNTYTTSSPSMEVTLTKGTPYSWFVISKSNKTSETAQSETWKFYLAGDGVINYSPFPASVIFPKSGATVSTNDGKIYIEWSGSDVDGDITSYDIYLDDIDGKTTLINENITSTKIENINVASDKVYFWRIITKDSQGNTSDSGVYTFKTN